MTQTGTGTRFQLKFTPPANTSTAQQGQREKRSSRTTAILKNASGKTAINMKRSERWSADKVAVAKAMRQRGDRQHDIAAYFGVNGGRIAEMYEKWPQVQPSREFLPPVGPYDIPCLIEAKNTANRRMAAACNDIVDACAELERICELNERLTNALHKLMRCAELLDRPI